MEDDIDLLIIKEYMKHIYHESDKLSKWINGWHILFPPIPSLHRLAFYGALVNGRPICGTGKNWRVVDSGSWVIDGIELEIVTRIPLWFSLEPYREIMIHMVVINELIKKGMNLVPTYGYFICQYQKASHGMQIAVPSEIKPKSMDGKDHLCFVQQRLNGITLHHFLEQPNLDEHSIAPWIQQTMDLLSTLEASEFQLYHHDLHPSNLMICDGRVYLLDMECVECTIGELRTQTLLSKRQYCGGKEAASNLYSGAYDIYMFLFHLYRTSHTRIRAFARRRIRWFWKCLVTKWENNEFIHQEPVFEYKSDLFEILSRVEQPLFGEEKTKVHAYNIELLSKMTYAYLRKKLFC